MNKYNRRERGSTILETLLCIGILMIVFFGLIQVFNFAVANMICEYSAFYAAKSHALGYTPSITRRAARVAAMPASGRDLSAIRTGTYDSSAVLRRRLSDRARDYMQFDRAGTYHINYEYWLDQELGGSAPFLSVGAGTNEKTVSSTVAIYNKPMFDFLRMTRSSARRISSSRVEMINHSRNYLRSDGYHVNTPQE